MESKNTFIFIMALLPLLCTSMDFDSEFPELDAVDYCILACDECYRENLLVRCANDCIKWNGDLPNFWKRTCPHFITIPTVQQI